MIRTNSTVRRESGACVPFLSEKNAFVIMSINFAVTRCFSYKPVQRNWINKSKGTVLLTNQAQTTTNVLLGSMLFFPRLARVAWLRFELWLARHAFYICCDEIWRWSTRRQTLANHFPHNVHSSCFLSITITSQSHDNISINMEKTEEGHLVKQSWVVTKVSFFRRGNSCSLTKRFVVVHLSLCFVIYKSNLFQRRRVGRQFTERLEIEHGIKSNSGKYIQFSVFISGILQRPSIFR